MATIVKRLPRMPVIIIALYETSRATLSRYGISLSSLIVVLSVAFMIVAQDIGRDSAK